MVMRWSWSVFAKKYLKRYVRQDLLSDPRVLRTGVPFGRPEVQQSRTSPQLCLQSLLPDPSVKIFQATAADSTIGLSYGRDQLLQGS